jgi:putative membrane protein
MWGLILSILIAIIIAAFATLNNAPVSVNLFLWQAPEISLALVVLISVLVGVIMAALFGFPQYLKNMQRIRELERKVKDLESRQTTPEISEIKNEEEKKQTPSQD